MGINDLLITPFVILGVYALLFLAKDKITNKNTAPYLLPAFTLKIVGGLAVGFIYQFYYGYGDTFYYFSGGIKPLHGIFLENPAKGLEMIFSSSEISYLKYADTIENWTLRKFLHDTASFFVVRVGAFFSIFVGATYSSIAVLFAVLSFSGMWALFIKLEKLLPALRTYFSIGLFFLPSVFFWGSGLLKDPLTICAVAWAVYALIAISIDKQYVFPLIVFFASCFVMYSVKIYILMCFMPAAIFFVLLNPIRKMKYPLLRISLTPILIGVSVLLGYFAIKEIGADNQRYSLETVQQTAEVTARYLTSQGDKVGGSTYNLGDYDYSFSGIMKKTPLSIVTTLFRPFLWESNNVVMLLSSFENLFFLICTIVLFTRYNTFKIFKTIWKQPFLLFCFLFSITFSLAVGITTYNFGSLVRYKIPMMPFYLIFLFLTDYILHKEKIAKSHSS